MNRRVCVRVCLAAVLLLGVCAYVPPSAAQPTDQEAATDPAVLAEAYGKLRQQRFYRNASAVYDQALRFTQMDPTRKTPADEFVQAFFEGRWDQIRETLDKLPEDLAAGIYDKMLSDLSGRYIPVMDLEDFLGVADACPVELDSGRIQKLGILLRVSVAKEQEVWLKQVLEKGNRHLGREGAKRLATGRILMHANFDELAREYLPSAVEASQIEDSTARNEVLQFLASQEQLEEFQQSRIADLWQQQARVLTDPLSDSGKRQLAANRLADLLGQASSTACEPWMRSLVGKDLEAALQLATALGKQSHGRQSDRNIAMRTNYLQAQKTLMNCVSDQTGLAEPPWDSVAEAMADAWIREAEHTFDVHPSYRSGPNKPHVAPGDLLDSAPDGRWAESLAESFRERIDVCQAKAVLVSDQYQEAVPRIVTLAKRNPTAGVAMAEEYLKAWAFRHDPELPEAIRKQYNLAADARIAVTPIMMEKNIRSLAEMMQIFREQGIHPRNGPLLVDAFDVCYSDAEVYQRQHIEQVFGSIDQMDEDILFHIIRTMTRGLSSRWRGIELQRESGTQRTEQETLEMVRGGYRTAIEMVDQRCKTDPDAWRILALAGSLLSDWADFEYFQQLVADSSTNRMQAFREKNNQAEQSFGRAAEAYARCLPKLPPGQQSIEVYLAWFHSLLGINSGGTLNLAKPLDRQALNALRDAIRQLPDGQAAAHINRFAKHVQNRLEDTENPLHEELKYKYLAGSLVITKESPFAFQASDKVSYYDQLLDEIRLETRVDGPNKIHRDDDFGIILSVYHTEAMGRMADFGKYLVNEAPPPNAPSRNRSSQPVIETYQMTQLQGRRDELEMNLREALELFFDIRSITFSPRDVTARPTDRAGWEETVLAYVHARAKDSSVDKIPRIQMSLEFLDLTGPVSIAAESAETMIKVTDQPTPPRPFESLDIIQTLDARNLASDEQVSLEVRATASGLVPELDDVLDLDGLREQLPLVDIDGHAGTLVRQINSWGETVHAVSERQWTIRLDAASLIDPPQRIKLRLPAARTDSAMSCRAYVDLDLVDLEEPIVTIGSGDAPATAAPVSRGLDPRRLAAMIGIGVLAVAILGLLLWRMFAGRERPVRARDVFQMPGEIDGFVAVQLLRALGGSQLVRLSPADRAEMQGEIDRIQAACFQDNRGDGLSEEELRGVVRKWLRVAC